MVLALPLKRAFRDPQKAGSHSCVQFLVDTAYTSIDQLVKKLLCYGLFLKLSQGEGSFHPHGKAKTFAE